jgi:PTS system N-acetylgalactosamine-specific IIC component
MGILIAVLILLAADTCGFTNVLHRPLIACTLIGAAAFTLTQGISTGIVCELVLLAVMKMVPAEAGGVLLYGIYTVAAVKGGMEPASAAIAALPALFVGSMLSKAIQAVSALLLPSARKAASQRKDATLGILNLVPLVLSTVVFTVVGALVMTQDCTAVIAAFTKMPAVLLLAVSWAGILLQCLGLAVLLRNIGAGSKKGMIFAGFAAALIILSTNMPSFALAGCSAFALGMMLVMYENSHKESLAKTETKKGGNDKWW